MRDGQPVAYKEWGTKESHRPDERDPSMPIETRSSMICSIPGNVTTFF